MGEEKKRGGGERERICVCMQGSFFLPVVESQEVGLPAGISTRLSQCHQATDSTLPVVSLALTSSVSQLCP